MTSTPHSSSSKGYMISILAALIFSTSAIFIRFLTETYQIPTLVLAFWRDMFVVLVLGPTLLIINADLLKIPFKQLKYLAGFGLILALYNAIWTYAVVLTGAALATVLVYTSTAFTVLLGRWFLKENLFLGKWIAVLLSFSGIVLVSGLLNENNSLLNMSGILLGILSGLMYAIYSMMGRSASHRGLNPWATLLYTFGFASFFLLVFNLSLAHILPGTAQSFKDFFWLRQYIQGWMVLFLLAIGPTLFGYGLYNVSLCLLPSSVANLILTLEPPFTVLIAFLLLGEHLTTSQLIGSFLIVMGVFFLQMKLSHSPWKSAQPGL
ncbi:MAG: DMT family transporter [Anaerolineaceae bacterium]|nr:DMT family transporter [Anaerolineaceae bacterium]